MPTLWPAHFMFEALTWQYGGSPFSPDGSRVTIATDAGRKALEWMTSMYRRGYSPSAVAQDSQFNAFANGTNAITWDGIWMVLAVADVPGGAGVAPLPRIGTEKATWANSHNLVVFNRPTLDPVRVEACMVFIEWLSRHSLDWAKAGQVPARNSVRESPEFAKLGPQATFAKELPYARLVPVGPGIGDIQDDTILNAVDSALRSSDPAAALRYQQKICNDELQLTRDQYVRS
jgi:multiple sugar transport system substrate-binding protein